MVKVKIFGVIRSTTGFGYLEVEAKSVKDIFDEISKKMEKGYKEDKEKLEQMKNGEITDEELLASKTAICDQLISVKDMLGSIDSWYASNVFYENEQLDDYIGYINDVTKQDVIDIANKISLDTVYFLGSNKE